MRDMLWAMVVAIGAPPAAAFLGPPASLASPASAAVTASATAIPPTAPRIARVPAAPQVTTFPAAAAGRESAEERLPGESIPTYDVVLTIRPDGVLHVRETITYDFRGREHGIVRRVPYRVDNRLYDIRDVRASSSTGAPARVKATKMLHEVRISVGGGHRTVSGRQAYVIEYDVTGVLTSLPDGHAELHWDAIGTGWDVPIGEVSVRVETPVRPLGVSCRAGEKRRAGLSGDDAGLTRCGWDRDGLHAVDFTQGGLRPHESVLIKARLPEGAVQVPPPRYARPHFAASWPGYVALGLGLAAALTLWLPRSGRRAAALLRWRPGARSPRWRPGRRTGTALVAAGTALVALDLADDVVAHGVWAASMGDPALVGLGLLTPGMILFLAGRRGGAAEREASQDQRA
ncbi:Predicted membrane protein [Thermomonospora echinospora]|uniref:Predicted membrane protein n=1 Tax=Thermomonospora echinospora TaxID=1992 RepID=A0A1H5VY82_9ACTN|nr:DUF2207 domain-containing protein [Thermomonospora echinospora]SEF91946.1 Predicted membrane protein [Thermomonospora echinospora]